MLTASTTTTTLFQIATALSTPTTLGDLPEETARYVALRYTVVLSGSLSKLFAHEPFQVFGIHRGERPLRTDRPRREHRSGVVLGGGGGGGVPGQQERRRWRVRRGRRASCLDVSAVSEVTFWDKLRESRSSYSAKKT